jgi:hypothetical protein
MILELTEYQPAMLPAAGLSEETGKFLFENFKDQIVIGKSLRRDLLVSFHLGKMKG